MPQFYFADDKSNDKIIPVTNIDNEMDVEHDDREGWIYWVEQQVNIKRYPFVA